MASLIPPLSGCLRRMTSGEKRVARLLESKLEDDYLCWYEPRVGTGIRARYTDFVVLHAGRGLLLLEVKDWKLENLRRFDRNSVELLTDTGLKRRQNPLEQARQCTLRLVDALKRDPALRQPDGPHVGKIACPWAFGVVLTNISRDQFERHELGAVLPEHLVICRDEMTADVDAEAFQTRLWNMFPTRFQIALTLPQIDRVRWHLFPEIRVEVALQGSLLDVPTGEASSIDEVFPDIVRVMDIRQERLARGLGAGHRVIHGVAGSGKTMILGYRCLHLANLFVKPILVLCFNVALAARLRELMAERGLDERVHVRSFHAWCDEQLRAYHVERPPSGENGFDYRALVQRVIDATSAGRIPRAQYGAVMIDEGHDFEADWLRLVVGMIDPDSDSLLLLYDDAQAIYKSRRELGFSLSSVGVQARGRTTVLKVNYRNTDEILAFACRFAHDWLVPDEADEDGVPLLAPEGAGRHGPEPAVRHLEGFDEEARLIVRTVRRQHEQGMAWSDMAVVYRENWMGKALAEELAREGVPLHWLRGAADKRRLSTSDASVKLMTMHSSKGLEFPFVAVAGVGAMPNRHEEVTAEAKLLYVAMTRATEKLLVTAHRDSAFARRLAA